MSGSQFLKRSADIYHRSPFISHSSKNDGKRKIITYQDAYQIATHYNSWIENLLLTTLGTLPINNDGVEVVIAFLSHNSPQLVLSMIGSMDVPKRFEHQGKKLFVKTAMLNARWSPEEIATAMRVHESTVSVTSERISGGGEGKNRRTLQHVTVMLCSKEMEETAQSACRILQSVEEQQSGLYHVTYSALIPDIDQRQFQSDNNKNGQTRSHHLTFVGGNSQSRDDGSSTHNDDAILLFTSGTTSGPKGVRLSLSSLLVQAMAKISSPCSYNSETRMLATTVPFFHVGGLSSTLAIIMAGGMLYFPSKDKSGVVKPGFDPHVVLQSMNHRNNGDQDTDHNYDTKHTQMDVNTLVIVPAMLHAILSAIIENENQGTRISTTYDNVRLLLVGGQSMTQPQLKKAKLRFPNARIVQTFACTEAGSSITFATIHDPKVRLRVRNNNNTVGDGDNDGDISSSAPTLPLSSSFGMLAGFPPHHIDLRIFKLDSNNNPTTEEAPTNQVGAIGTRGLHVMNGYWKRGMLEQTMTTDEMNCTTRKHDWFILSDLGYISDDGQLYFCGRSNDVIRTGGESVFAPEVETILLRHSQVDQCAVFALPDEKFGERVCAALVMKPTSVLPSSSDGALVKNGGQTIDDKTITRAPETMMKELRLFCMRQNLTGYKRPRTLFLCREFPRNSSGKVLKRQLSSMCARFDTIHTRSKL